MYRNLYRMNTSLGWGNSPVRHCRHHEHGPPPAPPGTFSFGRNRRRRFARNARPLPNIRTSLSDGSSSSSDEEAGEERPPVATDTGVVVNGSAGTAEATGTTVPTDRPAAENTGEESGDEKPPRRKVKVKKVDLNKDENRRSHHGTDKYDVENLVLRRGQSFTVTITFKRVYRPKYDTISFLLATGEKPMISKGTQVKIPMVETLSPKEWGAVLKSSDGKVLTFEIMIAADAIVGKYRLIYDIYLEGRPRVRRRRHKEDFYILFNAWCEDDIVYLEGELEREEYVLNDSGKIWQGNSWLSRAKSWNFAQFESESFLAAIFLLEESKLSNEHHGNPIRVCRALSAMVNSNDDDGVLEGNWSGDYGKETSPSAWNGSHEILIKFMKTKKGVKYGQCWVFSGVLTTVCRSLGIPTRSVTNFDSAHDSNDDCTIDTYLDHNDEKIGYRSDSVWNFHVWNEAWMKRSDLPDGNDGWQAFDSTPQESSDNLMQCGPAPLAALKRGDVNLSYDSKFIFGEVNGDRVTWKLDKQENESIIMIDTTHVGRNISTKAVISDEREVITHLYKPEEGSEEAKETMKRAMYHLRNESLASRTRVKMIEEYKGISRVRDVKFAFNQTTEASGNVHFSIVVENLSSENRTASVRAHVVATYYTGEDGDDLSRFNFKFDLVPNDKKEEAFTIEAKDWMNTVAEDANMAAYFTGAVHETGQMEHKKLQAELEKPDLEMTASSSVVKIKEDVDINMQFTNPLNISLEKIVIKLEGAGITPETIKISEPLAAGATLHKSVTVTPKRVGKRREVLGSLNSRQLTGISGAVQIKVEN